MISSKSSSSQKQVQNYPKQSAKGRAEGRGHSLDTSFLWFVIFRMKKIQMPLFTVT